MHGAIMVGVEDVGGPVLLVQVWAGKLRLAENVGEHLCGELPSREACRLLRHRHYPARSLEVGPSAAGRRAGVLVAGDRERNDHRHVYGEHHEGDHHDRQGTAAGVVVEEHEQEHAGDDEIGQECPAGD